MWILTVFHKNKVSIYEFPTEKEALEMKKKIKGSAFLTELIGGYCA